MTTLKTDNVSAAEYLSNLELRTTLTQKQNIFSKMGTDEDWQIIQVKMNNLLPKLDAVITGPETFSEIIALPNITIGFWMKQYNKEENEFFAKLFNEQPGTELSIPLEFQEFEPDGNEYYNTILKDPDNKTNDIPEADVRESASVQSDNGVKTKFLSIQPSNLVINFKGTDPQNPMDFVNIKEQFLKSFNNTIQDFIFKAIRYNFPDIEPEKGFIELNTTEIFDEEPEIPGADGFGQFGQS